jgi:hypothetical protein
MSEKVSSFKKEINKVKSEILVITQKFEKRNENKNNTQIKINQINSNLESGIGK